MPVRISAFEVPAQHDESFVSEWDRAASGSPGATLHRALRADVRFRFVGVARDTPEGELSSASHSASYDVVHQDGAPDGREGVMFINPSEVPDDADETFLHGWNRAREALAGRPGYLGTRLHRSVGPADFRFVNVARWSSPLMFAKALGRPEFREAAGQMPFPSHPALYKVIRGG
jgi:heme-degrading monooxygenase HmoA